MQEIVSYIFFFIMTVCCIIKKVVFHILVCKKFKMIHKMFPKASLEQVTNTISQLDSIEKRD